MSQAEALTPARRPGVTCRTVPIVAVTSGKGGVGKTALTANLAALLAARGLRVLLLDADYGLANLAVMFGVSPRLTLLDAIEGRAPLARVVTEPRAGIALLPGGSGARRLSTLTAVAAEAMVDAALGLASGFDLLLIDTAAGVGPAVMATLGRADHVLLVLNEDPASFVDAYAVTKLHAEACVDVPPRLVLNQLRSRAAGTRLEQAFTQVTERFLGLRPATWASIPFDAALHDAVREQRLAAQARPMSPAIAALRSLAERLAGVASERHVTSRGTM